MNITDQDLLDTLSDAVRAGKSVRIPVSGRSMGTGFSLVTHIAVEPFAPAAVRIGDVIVFQRDGRWIVHRVLWKFGPGADAFCITKGDGLGEVDRPYVKASDIRGTVGGLITRKGASIDLASVPRRVAGVLAAMRGWLAVALFALCKRRTLQHP